MRLRYLVLAEVPLAALASPEVAYSQYILSPSSRTLRPQSIYQISDNFQDAPNLVDPTGESLVTFTGSGSYVTVDFGQNIAGSASFRVESVEGTDEAIGLTFTESSQYISAATCDATQDDGLDEPLWFNLTGPGFYDAGIHHQRGGFRYLTVVHNSTGTVSISNFTIHWTAAPEMDDLTAYTGYFHSSSEKLNRVWYAGAYTNQLCSIDPSTGNSLGLPLSDWYLNYNISNGKSVLVDGGKRDRIVWPGDIAISGPSMFVSTNSLDPIRNGLDSLLEIQQADGALPYAGNPFNDYIGNVSGTWEYLWSFTYHCHTLNDVYDYYLFTGNLTYLESVWDKYKLGTNYLLQFIDDTGLANVTSSRDWLRLGMGGHNIEANSILYYTLGRAIKLAGFVNDTSEVSKWNASAEGIPPAANQLLWDATANLYRDNDTEAILYPQDGNAWAILSGVASGSRAEAVSAALEARWIRPYGAPAPEGGATISPFVSGFEIQAHYMAGRADRAVDLVEFMWADFMLDDPRMTNSSFIEGYSTDGSLHYPAYENDPRVSHAHGWATGPTSTLSFLAAGVQLASGAGQTWKIAPALGGLSDVEAGYESPLGRFSASWHNSTGGLTGTFSTPHSTSGVFELLVSDTSKQVTLTGPNGAQQSDVSASSVAAFENLVGGEYIVEVC